MSFLPIDIQTVIGQMGTVGKMQHVADTASTVQQNYVAANIKKESEIKDTKVDDPEAENPEENKINSDSKKFSQKGNGKNNKHTKSDYLASKDSSADFIFKDPSLGNIIDVKQ